MLGGKCGINYKMDLIVKNILRENYNIFMCRHTMTNEFLEGFNW